jgi:hypothetical protein
MILPDDVISLISEYSRPLKRRIVSDYWKRSDISSDGDMIADAITHIACLLEHHCWFAETTLRLDIDYIGRTTDKIAIDVWTKDDECEYLEMKLQLTMHHILNWKKNDEYYHVGLTEWYQSHQCITQLINNNGKIVKLL